MQRQRLRRLKETQVKKNFKKIIFACDAGMGSSAMGATTLRNKLKRAGLNIEVVNCAIEDIPLDAEIVVTHEQLSRRAKAVAPKAEHIAVKDFVENSVFDMVCNMIDVNEHTSIPIENEEVEEPAILRKKNIKLGLKSIDKFEAIKMAGNVLYESGYINEEYIDAMIEREKDLTTYIGKGIAIPHGVGSAKEHIKKSGMVVLQFPEGVIFDEEIAYMIIGIAGIGDEHLSIITNIANVLDEEDEKIVEILKNTKKVEQVYELFTVKRDI